MLRDRETVREDAESDEISAWLVIMQMARKSGYHVMDDERKC